MNELKRIEEGNTELIGRSGKKYYLGTLISARKYAEFEIAQRELATGLSVSEMFNELSLVYKLLTEVKVRQTAKKEMIFDSNNVEAGRKIHNIVSGLQKINQRRSTVMKIACLYIVAEGEEPGVYNEDLERVKIADLETQYPYKDFFRLATAGLQELIDDLNKLSQLGLEMPQMDQE